MRKPKRRHPAFLVFGVGPRGGNSGLLSGADVLPWKKGGGFKAVKYISNFVHMLLYFLNVESAALKTLKTGHFGMEKGEKAYYTYGNEDR